jgi:hypothetical protein
MGRWRTGDAGVFGIGSGREATREIRERPPASRRRGRRSTFVCARAPVHPRTTTVHPPHRAMSHPSYPDAAVRPPALGGSRHAALAVGGALLAASAALQLLVGVPHLLADLRELALHDAGGRPRLIAAVAGRPVARRRRARAVRGTRGARALAGAPRLPGRPGGAPHRRPRLRHVRRHRVRARRRKPARPRLRGSRARWCSSAPGSCRSGHSRGSRSGTASLAAH